MSTIVYQGLQSCMESQVIETTTLKLKVASMELSRGPFMAASDTMEIKEKYHHQEINKKTTNGGWSFLQCLSNISSAPKEANEKQSSYEHPLAKRSPRLSQESLELCTENLGSETGCESFASDDSASERSPVLEQFRLPGRQMESKSKASSRSFPPPLTSIRSSNPLQVKSHRENGRLIIEAIETPSRNTYLQADRSNGRLRLSFWKDSATDFDSELTNQENDQQETIDEFESDIDENEDNNNYQEEDEEEEEEEDEHEQEQEYERDAYISNKDMEGNTLNHEVEFGMENFQRPSRCKEGGLCNWKPLWVATS